jgi:solute carrier family 29 (equilibrative nucleoside transporter), member 1/2/3
VIEQAIFPAITSAVHSVNAINPQLFSALHFLVFNCFDWLGRYVCSFPRFQIWSRKRLLALSLSRTVFIVLFLACNLDFSSNLKSESLKVRGLVLIKESIIRMVRSEQETPFINSDLAFFALLALLAFSNGWLTSLIMMSAPSLEHNKRMKKEWVDVAAVGSSFR